MAGLHGLDVSWVKKKLKLHFGKNKDYKSMSNDELLYGITRVGDWSNTFLTPEMKIYAVLDSTVLVQTAVTILWLTLSTVHLSDLEEGTNLEKLLERFEWSKNLRVNSAQIQADSETVKRDGLVLPERDFMKNKLAKARVNKRTESKIESKEEAWDRSRLAAKQVISSKKGEFDRLHSGRKKEIQRRRRTGQISDL